MADNALQVQAPSTALARPETFAPRTLQEALQFADLLLESGMIPKSYVGKSPAAIVVALQFGMELGMQPMQALQNIANINGSPGVWGDAALALVLGSGLCEYYEEDNFETIKKNEKATFTIKRREERRYLHQCRLEDLSVSDVPDARPQFWFARLFPRRTQRHGTSRSSSGLPRRDH